MACFDQAVKPMCLVNGRATRHILLDSIILAGALASQQTTDCQPLLVKAMWASAAVLLGLALLFYQIV